MMFGLLAALVLTADDTGNAAPATRPNLLKSATVRRAEGLPKISLLADGVASTDGDIWDNKRAAIFEKGGVAEWDLGQQETIAGMRLQADNNDRYELFGSLDGEKWFPIWVAGPVDLPGVQTRTSSPLRSIARYLRLTASGGDSKYSLTELEVFDSAEAMEHAKLERVEPPPPPPPPPAPPFDTGWVVVLGSAAIIGKYFRDTIRRNQQRRADAAKPEAPAAPAAE